MTIEMYGKKWDKKEGIILWKNGHRYRQCHVCMINFVDIDVNPFLACQICYDRVKDKPNSVLYLKAFKKLWMEKLEAGEFN